VGIDSESFFKKLLTLTVIKVISIDIILDIKYYKQKTLGGIYLETIAIDSRTLIIKSNNEEELPEIINFINQKNKNKIIDSFLDFASRNRIKIDYYKFNREDCYDR